ncbi:MAG: mechanosensitive ion channel domain-containing protein, partial [Ginsengibacter sp.]
MNETIINKRGDKKNPGMIKDKSRSRSGYLISGYAITAASFLVLHFLIELKLFDLIEEYKPLVRKITMTFFFIFLILLLGKLVERLVNRHSQSKGNRYNLVRITRFLTKLFVLIVIVSFLFQNWYTAAVSFGLLSLILGFALQVPISSFIAWLYIIFRTPYRVGDRIEINGFKGDVVGIDYLDTTLLEFSGNYLTNDRRSGRVIRFPNSMVLRLEVFNYSGPQVPFI